MIKRILFLTLVLAAFGCNKDEGSHIKIPQEFKDVGYFKTNSWWVYKNESTTSSDCTYVTTDLIFDARSETSTQETIYLTYGGNNFKSSEIVSYGYYLKTLCGYHIFMFHPYVIKDTLYNFDINNLTFPIVYRTQYIVGIDSAIIFDSYLAPHVGLVKLSKKEQNTDTTLTLVRYNVIQ